MGQSRFSTWLSKAESAEIDYNWAELEQLAGLEFDDTKSRLIRVSKAQERLYNDLLNGNVKLDGDLPADLKIIAIERANRQKSSDLKYQINAAKRDNVSSDTQFEGSPVNISNWRLFNSRNVENIELRQAVFREICEKAFTYLAPLVKEYFSTAVNNFKPYKTTPSNAFAERVGLPLDEIVEIIENAGSRAKNRYFELAAKNWPELLGHDFDPERPEDDLYVLREVKGKGLNEYFSHVKTTELISRVMEGLGIKPFFLYTSIDSSPRNGKHASPFCQPVQVPQIVKILYQEDPKNPGNFGTVESALHEMGHAAHFTSIKSDIPFYDRAEAFIHPSKAEIYSTLFDSLASNPTFLSNELGVPAQIIEKILERDTLFELAFIALYTPLNLLKIEMLNGETDPTKAAERFEQLTEQYGVKLPGGYAFQHHVFSGYDWVYEPGYLLAKIRSTDLAEQLRNMFGDSWYKNKDAGEYLMKDIFGPGNQTNVNAFSSLKSRSYFKELGI